VFAGRGASGHSRSRLKGGSPLWDTDPNTLRNPRALIEILSPGTKDYDRGTRFELYRGLPSLIEYVYVHKEAPYIEHQVGQPDGSWLMRDLRGMDAVLRLASATAEAPFHILYEGIEFDPPR
jgi:Uma2 family endonuclease